MAVYGYGYQDASFEVIEVAGEALEEFVILMEDGRPQKLLGRLTRGDSFEAYLSAFIGFWFELDDEGVRGVRGDYAELPEIDLLSTHALHDQPIVRAWCERVTGAVRVTVQFSSGELRLEEVDPRDCHSDATLRFVPDQS